MWFVYILECSDNTYYTGVTNDIGRRLLEHNKSKLGSKYTRARRPVVLKYRKKFMNRSNAQKEESRIKKLSRIEKKKIIKCV